MPFLQFTYLPINAGCWAIDNALEMKMARSSGVRRFFVASLSGRHAIIIIVICLKPSQYDVDTTVDSPFIIDSITGGCSVGHR